VPVLPARSLSLSLSLALSLSRALSLSLCQDIRPDEPEQAAQYFEAQIDDALTRIAARQFKSNQTDPGDDGRAGGGGNRGSTGRGPGGEGPVREGHTAQAHVKEAKAARAFRGDYLNNFSYMNRT